ncbi:uncharacterized protein J3R85_006250 [Psidium guajava]|nr:uncharacterized protein J3R85_006250 [Psidium guajava]
MIFMMILAECGAGGVKVDIVQNILETLGQGYSGRVALARQYQEALIARNFKENSIICCMCHNSESIYSLKKSPVARALENFIPREPTFQTLHAATVAFNGLLLGEIVAPDWVMFYVFDRNVRFAPIGLLDMYKLWRGRGRALTHVTDPSWCVSSVKVRGCGRFGAYSSSRPKWCKVDATEGEFPYSEEGKSLTLKLPGERRFWDVEVVH